MKEKAGDSLLWQLLPKRDVCSLKLKQNRKIIIRVNREANWSRGINYNNHYVRNILLITLTSFCTFTWTEYIAIYKDDCKFTDCT